MFSTHIQKTVTKRLNTHNRRHPWQRDSLEIGEENVLLQLGRLGVIPKNSKRKQMTHVDLVARSAEKNVAQEENIQNDEEEQTSEDTADDNNTTEQYDRKTEHFSETVQLKHFNGSSDDSIDSNELRCEDEHIYIEINENGNRNVLNEREIEESIYAEIQLSDEENSIGRTNQGFTSEELLSKQSMLINGMATNSNDPNVEMDTSRMISSFSEDGSDMVSQLNNKEDSDEEEIKQIRKEEDSCSPEEEDQYDTPDEDAISQINLVITPEDSSIGEIDKHDDTKLDSISQVIHVSSSEDEEFVTKDDKQNEILNLNHSTISRNENLSDNKIEDSTSTDHISTDDDTLEKKRLSGRDFINQLVENLSVKKILTSLDSSNDEDEVSKVQEVNEMSLENDQTTLILPPEGNSRNDKRLSGQDFINQLVEEFSLKEQTVSEDNPPEIVQNKTIQHTDNSITQSTIDLPVQKVHVVHMEDQDETEVCVEQEQELLCELTPDSDFSVQNMENETDEELDPKIENSVDEPIISIQEQIYEMSVPETKWDDLTIDEEDKELSRLDDNMLHIEGDQLKAKNETASGNVEIDTLHAQVLKTIIQENKQTNEKLPANDLPISAVSCTTKHNEIQPTVKDKDIIISDVPDQCGQSVQTKTVVNEIQQETLSNNESVKIKNRDQIINTLGENTTNSTTTLRSKQIRNDTNQPVIKEKVVNQRIDSNKSISNPTNRKLNRLISDETNSKWPRNFAHEQFLLIYMCYFIIITLFSTLFTLTFYSF